MAKIDPGKESQRLVELYASMSDEELQKISEDAAALTEWAHQALRMELQKRGFALDHKNSDAHKNSAAQDDPGNKPVVLRRYRDMPEAVVEKSVLENAGIRCFLQDDNVIRMDWLWSNAMGGIKLMVRQKETDEAEKILSESPGEVQGDTDIEP